jgi:lipopolysaccharide/colanic/teichoic acid biosynthesis glycosyltransferase
MVPVSGTLDVSDTFRSNQIPQVTPIGRFIRRSALTSWYT